MGVASAQPGGAPPRDRRFFVALLVTAGVAISFWAGSRYPSLEAKAAVGGSMFLEALGFDQVWPTRPDDSWAHRTVFTFLNWTATNWRGMAFGLALAASLMTLLSLARRRGFEGSFANTALGVAVGSPLGVCVNCAAPIARGLHAAGSRLETTLAAMLSSPTLNFVVLGMLFGLLPTYLALTKLGLTFAFLLVWLPLLTRTVFRRERAAAVPADDAAERWSLPLPASTSSGAGWIGAVRWVGRSLTGNLWFILRATLPLMLLAGILGAALVQWLPLAQLAEPLDDASPLVLHTTLLLTALVATLLPVPISFDVVLSAGLFGAGAPPEIVGVLLFGLPIFSVYSFMILWSGVSRRVAVVLLVLLTGFSYSAGLLAHEGHRWHERRQREISYGLLPDVMDPWQKLPRLPAASWAEVSGALVAAPRHVVVAPGLPRGISMERIPFRATAPVDGPSFVRRDAGELGIAAAPPLIVARFQEPHGWGRAIAAGDVHGDGYPDLVVSEDRARGGLSLHANRGGAGFVRQRVELPVLEEQFVTGVALLDLDGDGWLDLFASTYGGGNWVARNQQGRFLERNLERLPDVGTAATVAPVFADLDRDGDLDIVLGNWSLGSVAPKPRDKLASANFILWQEDGGFRPEPIDEGPGETLSALVADIDRDGIDDLVVGNDFETPDEFHLGLGGGRLRRLGRDDGVVPVTTWSTMSVASADVDNDLVPELFLAQIARGTGEEFAGRLFGPEQACAGADDGCIPRLERARRISRSLDRHSVEECLEIALLPERDSCIVLHALRRAARKGDRAICEPIPAALGFESRVCTELFAPVASDWERRHAAAIPQQQRHNVLLRLRETGGFEDAAARFGLTLTGWTWNARFADLDLDGWKDLYVANGYVNEPHWETNMFLWNRGGEGFADRTEEAGLGDVVPTGSFVTIDFDRDGDLDIVSLPVWGPARLFENRSGGHAIAFSLRDARGNPFGVGSEVTIAHGPGGALRQLGQIQAGGGFRSLGPLEAHFGLGASEQVDWIGIRWSTGETTRIEGPFAAGAEYRVARR